MTDDTKDQCSEQEAAAHRDELLNRLLHMPPQPRPKRDRGNDKPTQNRAARQREKALAFCLSVRGFTRLLMG